MGQKKQPQETTLRSMMARKRKNTQPLVCMSMVNDENLPRICAGFLEPSRQRILPEGNLILIDIIYFFLLNLIFGYIWVSDILWLLYN